MKLDETVGQIEKLSRKDPSYFAREIAMSLIVFEPQSFWLSLDMILIFWVAQFFQFEIRLTAVFSSFPANFSPPVHISVTY